MPPEETEEKAAVPATQPEAQPSIPKVSICIASHNMKHFLLELLTNCISQEYDNLEIVLLDDGSTDGTDLFMASLNNQNIFYYKMPAPSGTGEAFNKAIHYATGEYVVLMCADDLFTNNMVIRDIVFNFQQHQNAVHVSRFYHQFIDGDRRPVRAWRGNDVMELANNPSGLAFKKSAIGECKLSNKMFVEAAGLVACIRQNALSVIIPYDTVAVRIHQSISRNKEYYKRRWVSSPVEEWTKCGGDALQTDFTSLVQIKNYFTTGAVLKECWNFIRLQPSNLVNPGFLFFAMVCIFTPRFILKHLPHIYRVTIGRWTTKEMKRP